MCSPSSFCKNLSTSYSLWYCRSSAPPSPTGPQRRGKPFLHLPAPPQPGCSRLGHCLRDTVSVPLQTAVGSCCVYLFKHLVQGRRLCQDPGQHELKTSLGSLHAGTGSLSLWSTGSSLAFPCCLWSWSERTSHVDEPAHPLPRETGCLCPCPLLRPGLIREHKSAFPSPKP